MEAIGRSTESSAPRPVESRTDRLFSLIDALRRRRRPVTAAVLAEELSVSERTIYRDIATLSGLGAPVEGEAGLGYVLRSGFFLPPLMFDEDEREALVLGARWVQRQADSELAKRYPTRRAALVKAYRKDRRAASARAGNPPDRICREAAARSPHTGRNGETTDPKGETRGFWPC